MWPLFTSPNFVSWHVPFHSTTPALPLFLQHTQFFLASKTCAYCPWGSYVTVTFSFTRSQPDMRLFRENSLPWYLCCCFWLFSHSVMSYSFATSQTVDPTRSGLPFPSRGDLPNPGIEPKSPALQADSLASEPPGKPSSMEHNVNFIPTWSMLYMKLSPVSDHRGCVLMDLTQSHHGNMKHVSKWGMKKTLLRCL